jgi:hypothetical protein
MVIVAVVEGEGVKVMLGIRVWVGVLVRVMVGVGGRFCVERKARYPTQ